MEVHEGDRHLIFPHGRKVERSEEEERYLKEKDHRLVPSFPHKYALRVSNRPAPVIQGIGIVLQTDEDIAKWIAERKAKWPSAKRVAEKVFDCFNAHLALMGCNR